MTSIQMLDLSFEEYLSYDETSGIKGGKMKREIGLQRP